MRRVSIADKGGMEIKHKEMQWRSDDGEPLLAGQWEPDSEVKGVICLVHGHGEHSGRYRHWAERLAGAGYAMLAIDLRGHGKSGGKRGDTPTFDHFSDDINLMLDEARREFKDIPCFLYGHSMGGLLALFCLIQRRPLLNGAVITSPLLHSVYDHKQYLTAMISFFSRIIPGLSISSNLEVDALAQDPAVIYAYRSDPLVHDRATLRLGKGLLDTIEYIFNRAGEIKLPLLIMHGTEDRINHASGSEKLAGLVSGDCTLELWESLYHELHNEEEKDEVFACLKNWLDSKLSSP